MEQEIDTEELIYLVEQYPALWDKNNPSYKNRVVTVLAWDEVCKKIHEDFEAMEEEDKLEFGQLVSKRWRNVRDSWIRAQRKSAESGRRYIFQKQLSFLERVRTPAECDSSLKKEEPEETDLERPASYRKRKISNNKSSVELQEKIAKPDEVPDKPVETNDLQGERHLSFFKSLIPSLNMLQEGQILEFQIGVLKLIQGLRSKTSDISTS